MDDIETRNAFSERAKPLKDKSGITLRELSERFSTAESTMSRYINGCVDPPSDLAADIIGYLQVRYARKRGENVEKTEDVRDTIEMINQQSNERIADLKEAIERQQRRIKAEEKVNRALLGALCGVLSVALAFLLLDAFHGSVGWITY